MDMDHAAFVQLQKQLQDHFDDRYRLAEVCDDMVKHEDRKIEELREVFNELKLEQVKTNTLLKVLIAILAAIGTAVLGVAVRLLFG